MASKPHPSSITATSKAVAERANRMLTALAPECLATLVRASWRMRYNPIWTAGGRLLESSSFECEIHSYVVGLCVLGNVSAQRNTQTMVVQHRWVKPAGEPSDFVDGLGSDFPQPMSLRLNICYVSGRLPEYAGRPEETSATGRLRHAIRAQSGAVPPLAPKARVPEGAGASLRPA